MAGKYFTNEDIRKMMTEKVKDYLDQGWYFNFKYMSCSNGYEFAAVTDGNDTVVIYFILNRFSSTNLNVEKFTGYNNEHENIWLEQGNGEILETTQFLYKYETDTYVMVNGYNEKENREKKHKRMHNRRDFNKKAISESMKETIAKYIKKKMIPGLKRFKVSDINSGYYLPGQNKYILEIKDRCVTINRDGWDVKVI